MEVQFLILESHTRAVVNSTNIIRVVFLLISSHIKIQTQTVGTEEWNIFVQKDACTILVKFHHHFIIFFLFQNIYPSHFLELRAHSIKDGPILKLRITNEFERKYRMSIKTRLAFVHLKVTRKLLMKLTQIVVLQIRPKRRNMKVQNKATAAHDHHHALLK